MNEQNPDPMSGIRAVLIAGFVSSNVVGLALLTLEGHLFESLRWNPLALFGAILAVGLGGMMTGAVCGLSVRLVLEKCQIEVGRGPVIFSAAASGVFGFWIAAGLIGALW